MKSRAYLYGFLATSVKPSCLQTTMSFLTSHLTLVIFLQTPALWISTNPSCLTFSSGLTKRTFAFACLHKAVSVTANNIKTKACKPGDKFPILTKRRWTCDETWSPSWTCRRQRGLRTPARDCAVLWCWNGSSVMIWRMHDGYQCHHRPSHIRISPLFAKGNCTVLVQNKRETILGIDIQKMYYISVGFSFRARIHWPKLQPWKAGRHSSYYFT